MAYEFVSTKARREQYWRRQLFACESSGKTIVQYCRDEGLDVSQYHWWKRELNRRGRMRSVTPLFAELCPAPPPLPATSEIEVALPGGRVVRVRRGFDAAMLTEVVRVLESLGDSGGLGC